MKKFSVRPSQKLKTLQRGTLIIACVSLAAIGTYILIGIGASRSLKSKANDALIVNDPINNGMILCGFSFEDPQDIKKADAGPSAISVSRNAEIIPGGNHGSMGLSAGNTGRNLDLTLPPDASFNTSGIDVSVDFKRMESSGNFMSRGNYFAFGMKDGLLCIKYRLKTKSGKTVSVDEIARYEIPVDETFRSYRFIYNPEEAKGEVFVDNVPVWSARADEGDVLYWNEKDEIVIGKELNGDGNPVAILDNIIIRSTMPARSMPLHLLSFTAEYRGHDVMLNWFTAKEDGTDYFRVERSSDTHNYQEIGRVKAAGRSDQLKAYALLDPRPQTGVSYYRLSLPNTDLKSVWVPVIALRIRQEMLPATPSEKASSLLEEYIKK